MGKPKYKVGQVLLYLDKKKIFEIQTAIEPSKLVAPRPPGRTDDILYTVVYLPKPKTGKPSFGRYYESKLSQTCIPITNTDMAQILYGIKI